VEAPLTTTPAQDSREQRNPFRLEPGRTGWALTLCALAVWGYAESVPGGILDFELLGLASTLCLLLSWIVRMVIAVTLRLRRKRPVAWRRFVVQPLIVVAVGTLFLVRSPLEMRFDLSHGAMDRTAIAVMAHQQDPRTIDRIGLFSVERAERIPGGFRFIVSDTGLFDESGFAYSPDGSPAILGEDTYEHLEGPWYVWEESW
jgi:hypothetical protein